MEAERDQLSARTADLEARLASLEAVEAERQQLAEEVAGLNKKNQFLFEELARERLRLESKIETLAVQSESRRRELAAVTKVSQN
jgi:cell division protein FtsB